MIQAVNRPIPLAVRRALRFLLRLPLGRVSGFRIHGAARLPASRRPLILAANHAAFIDTVYFILALRPRFTVCGAQPRLFRSRARRALMAVANILRVDDKPQFLNDCAALLRAGEILLIYPAMGRTRGLGEFKSWAAEVALACDVPLLPCFIGGTGTDQGPPRLNVGELLAPSGDPRTLTARLRERIAELEPYTS